MKRKLNFDSINPKKMSLNVDEDVDLYSNIDIDKYINTYINSYNTKVNEYNTKVKEYNTKVKSNINNKNNHANTHTNTHITTSTHNDNNLENQYLYYNKINSNGATTSKYDMFNLVSKELEIEDLKFRALFNFKVDYDQEFIRKIVNGFFLKYWYPEDNYLIYISYKDIKNEIEKIEIKLENNFYSTIQKTINKLFFKIKNKMYEILNEEEKYNQTDSFYDYSINLPLKLNSMIGINKVDEYLKKYFF